MLKKGVFGKFLNINITRDVEITHNIIDLMGRQRPRRPDLWKSIAGMFAIAIVTGALCGSSAAKEHAQWFVGIRPSGSGRLFRQCLHYWHSM